MGKRVLGVTSGRKVGKETWWWKEKKKKRDTERTEESRQE